MNIYSTKSMPYVYMCTHKETRKFYIGYRCANLNHNRPSHLDFPKYKSSCQEIKNNFNNYNWIILAEFFNSDSAYDYEQFLIYSNWSDPLLMNKSCFYLKNRFKSSPLSETHKKAISKAQSIPKTDSHKKKLSDANIGNRWFNNGKISIQSKECPVGFKPGRIIKFNEGFNSLSASIAGKKNLGKKQKLITCPHCGTIGGISTMKQHHFEKCSSIQLYTLCNIITNNIIRISKKDFKDQYHAALYHLLNGNVNTLKGWRLIF